MSDLEQQLARVARRLSRPVKVHGPSEVALLDRPAFLALSRLAEDGPMRPTTLAQRLDLDLSVVSRQLKALEDAGFVERQPDPADARASLVAPSADGREVYQQTSSRRSAVLDDALQGWSEPDLQAFTRLLARFNTDLDAAVERRRSDT